jgi:hypothetical protein
MTTPLPLRARVRINLPHDDAHGAPGTITKVITPTAYLVQLDEPTADGREVVFAEPWEAVPMVDGEITCSPGDRVRIRTDAPHLAAGKEATAALEVPQFHDFAGRQVFGYLLDLDGGGLDWLPAFALTPLTGATPGGTS